MLKTILTFYEAATAALSRGVSLRQILELPFRDRIATMKTTPHEEAIADMPRLCEEVTTEIAGIEVL
jgi:V/A-type H+-transporting ATPase subunit A